MLYVILASVGVLILFSVSRAFKLRQSKSPLHQENINVFKIGYGDNPGVRGKRVRAFLAKDMADECLLEDNKVYGVAFKNQQSPNLPHCAGCRCEYIDAGVLGNSIFSRQNRKKSISTPVLYMSDLGELNFYEYKYYKYNLLILRSSDDSEAKNYRELKDSLTILPVFKQKVSQHLE